MSLNHYILKNGKPVAVPLMEWARWLEDHADQRIVEQKKVGDFWVSTVFLGLDRSFSGAGRALLFETMVFPESDICRRWATLGEAKIGHWEIVDELALKSAKNHAEPPHDSETPKSP